MNEPHTASFPANASARIVAEVLATDKRLLLVGEMGSGKSTLAATLAAELWEAGRPCWCIGGDPGSPAFGPPGAVSLGRWQDGGWQTVDLEAVCSLDAGRFRLPLVQALSRLVARLPRGTVLVDAPGVMRGIAGAELLMGFTQATDPDAVLVLAREPGKPPLEGELRALERAVHVIAAHPQARRPGKPQRARGRTRLWDAYLGGAEERQLDLTRVRVIGTPPPLDVPVAWAGRQCALLDGERTVALGEIVALVGGALRVRMAPVPSEAPTLLVRDAERRADGMLETAKPFAAQVRYAAPPDVGSHLEPARVAGPRPVVRCGPATAILVNGIFGDPLLHLRLRHEKRSLLVDLGDPGRLPARIAHQVSDVFISHAHMDHIGGFLWLLRARMTPLSACRLYGPPGLSDNIAAMIGGVLWDRIGDRGPRFHVAELHGERLVRFRIQAGRRGPEPMDETAATEGILLDEPGFRMRAATLDHGTPVLAFAFEPSQQINVRKERLAARGLDPGPWLGVLKERILAGDRRAHIALPDGTEQTTGALADDLTLITPGEKLVYATDLADTKKNRERLIALARDAHTFFCEATFREDDAAQARRTGHLTARASGEIATAANVQRFIPFHFSRRYENAPEVIYQEVAAVCSRTVLPPNAGAAGQ